MNERSFDFDAQLRMSQGISENKNIEEILLECFPGAVKVEKANLTDDKDGIDYWVVTQDGNRHGVDVKVRDEDYSQKDPSKDDLALEIWSVMNADPMKAKVGWTRDTKKRTHYILWFWLDTGRWTLVPFPLLRSVFIEYWERWHKKYYSPIQSSHSNRLRWSSQCVFVPRKVVWNAIYAAFGGNQGNVVRGNKAALVEQAFDTIKNAAISRPNVLLKPMKQTAETKHAQTLLDLFDWGEEMHQLQKDTNGQVNGSQKYHEWFEGEDEA